jgi:hypothetical protein
LVVVVLVAELCTMAAALVLFTPALASACPVCGLTGNDANGTEYFAMTIMLSALPLAMIGGVVVWVRRRVIGADESDSPDRSPR